MIEVCHRIRRFATVGQATAAGRLVLILTLLQSGPSTLVRAGQADETELKATYVLNFLRMVRWTAIEGEADSTKLGVCAVANSELFGIIRASSRGKDIGGRTLTPIVTSDPTPAACRVLVFDSTQYSSAAGVLKHFRHRPVLTVGNGPGFLKVGGMFELVVADQRVQFDVSLEAIRESGLAVSARLLRLGRNLQPKVGDGS